MLSAQKTLAEIQRIEGMIDGILAMPALAADNGMASQAVVFLLRDAVQSYELSESGTNSVDYENAQGLVQVAESKYQEISDLVNGRRSEEINSFFAELDTVLEEKASLQDFSRLVRAIERDLSEELTVSSGATGGQHTQYFATIHTLLVQAVLLAVYLAGSMYVLVLRPRRQKMAESARKSRADLVSKQADIDVEDP